MKALKCWGWITFSLSAVFFLIGFLTGEFDKAGGLSGTSPSALVLSILSLIFLIISITVFLVIHAIKKA